MKAKVRRKAILLLLSALFMLITVGHIPHFSAWVPLIVMLWVCLSDRDFRIWAYKMSVKYVRLDD